LESADEGLPEQHAHGIRAALFELLAGGTLMARDSLISIRRRTGVRLALVFLLTQVAQGAPTPGQDARRSDAANEPTEIGAPAERDAAAAREAQEGWYAQALKTRDERLQWWRDARFGCFIHWGAYSVLGGQWKGQPNPGYAEHIMRVDRIPLAVYRQEVAAHFHPDAFDAQAWVRLIKAAGMRYVVITSKHHDGFALWPSTASAYNIRDVAHFDRDPLRELVDAARAQGLRVGFYYSHAFDWQDPDAPGNDWDYDNPGGDRQLHGGRDWWNADPEFLTRTDHYIHAKVIPQLQELITRYHPDILWFDTPGKLPFFQQAQIVEAVRKADPDVVINGRAARSGNLNLGDYLDTADRPAEVRPTPGDWEAIPTTNESYGWNALDQRYKPVSYFIQLIAKTAAKGGNTLLNIGPRGNGVIDQPDTAILEGIARWMQVNAESIRGTHRTPLDRQSWGDSTVKENRLYLHVFDWPANEELVVGGLQSTVRKVYLLGDAHRRALPFHWTSAHDLAIRVPAAAPDPVDTVIVVDTAGAVTAAPGRFIETRWGSTQLLAFDAQAQGSGFSYGDGKAGRYYVEGLESAGNSLQWNVRADMPANVRLRIRYSTEVEGPAESNKPAGGELVVQYGDQILRAPVDAVENAEDIRTAELGSVALKSGQARPLTLKVAGAQRVKVRVFEVLVR
jgi:hypothetical protein